MHWLPNICAAIDRDLVSTRPECRDNILDAPNAATHCHWDEDVSRGGFHYGQNIVAVIQRCDGIHIQELVYTLLIILSGEITRIAHDP
jgi:hypothetical protein